MAEKFDETARVISNRPVATGIWQMGLNAPKIAQSARAGQFVHLRIVKCPVQFLRMPFAVFAVHGNNGIVEIVYQVVGEGTRQLSELSPGSEVDLIGPIGNGWSAPAETTRALLVGGGVGTPALYMLAQDLVDRGCIVDVAIGALSKDRFSCVRELETVCVPAGGKVSLTTDDGSLGTKGFVTEVSDKAIASGAYDYVAVCGPTPMMRNVVKPALERGICCQVSMEKLMACGVGACLSCVVETTQGRRRCCVDGPVFNASEVIW
ncbi:MAG: dihydroorotate dehydrogenase electron transfer subunit [Coriobacteriales bacterium]|jgi:dihydroorotate dehydrogenase electron transfer subunit